MKSNRVVHDFHFPGTLAFPLAASPDGQPWRKKITSGNSNANGSVSAAAGFAKLVMSADSEVQNHCLYFGDDLSYDLDALIAFQIWLKLSAVPGDNTKVRFGLTSARNDDPDSIAQSILFGLNASSANVHLECDDGTNEVAATQTGLTLSTAVKMFSLDFRSNVTTGIPAYGGKYDVRAYGEDGTGGLAHLLKGTRLNLGAYSGGLQPFVQLQKASSTNTLTVSVARVRVEFELQLQ